MPCHLHAFPGNKRLVLGNVFHIFSVILHGSLSLVRNEIIFFHLKFILSGCIFLIVSLHTAVDIFLSVYRLLTDFTSLPAALFWLWPKQLVGWKVGFGLLADSLQGKRSQHWAVKGNELQLFSHHTLVKEHSGLNPSGFAIISVCLCPPQVESLKNAFST